MLEISADQINAFEGRDADFVALLRRLLFAEAQKHGLALGGIDVPAQITVPDGGDDGRIEWNAGTDHTDYVPARLTVFQIKATTMPRAKCRAEVVHELTGTLKPAVREALERSGAYIVFCTDACARRGMTERMTGLKEGIENAVDAMSAQNIHFYDANKVAAWVNQYPSVQVWVHEALTGSAMDGLQSWDSWSKSPHLRISTYDFAPGKTRDGRVDISALLQEVPRDLAQPRTVVRMVGLSGLGKTRIALEMFRPRSDPKATTIAPLNASVLYVNSSAGDNHIYRTFFRWRQDKRRLIFVVDDCPIELHRELADCARHPDSELSLLTLDFDTARSNDQDRRIQLGPFDDEPISDIVKQAYPGLGPSEASRVVSFANGFPGMAVLLGDAFLESVVNPASLQDDVLLNRLIWGRQPESEEGRNVLSACSLFAALGIDGARVNERAFVASSVCGISEDRLYHWVNLFKSRGLVQQHGDFVLVLPKPVALRLADERWRGIPKETAERWFSEDAPGNMPERLFNALCEQLSYLDFAPDAKELVDRLCSSRGPFGQPAALRTERGSRALRALVETNPDATMDALERAFDGESEAGLQAIDGEARRNLVGAIEKLIFRRGVFRRAARLLLAFSAAETESYSNNATGLFKDLFHLFLSGTQAIGDEKLALADEILASNDKHRRAIVVYGLADGLRTDHFTRMGGAEAQGSGRPLQDWQPTPLEARDYLHGIVTRLTKIGCGSDGLAAQARRGIAHNLRGLIGAGPLLFKVVAEAIEKIIESHGPYWPEALDSLTLSLRYEGPGFPDEFRHEVERLRNLLLPTDLTDRLRFFVSDLPWGFMGSDMDGAEKCARRLADELAQQPQVLFNALPELSYGEQRQTMAFGQRLGAVFDEPMQLLDKALAALAARPNGNPSLVGGIIWGLDKRSPDLVRLALDRCANDDALRPFLGYLTCRKRITAQDITRIVTELEAGRLPATELQYFSMGRALDHLEPEDVKPLIEVGLQHADGRSLAIAVLDMYTFQRPDRRKMMNRFIYRALSLQTLLEGKRSHAMVSHHLKQLGLALLNDEEYGSRMAEQVARWTISVCEGDAVHDKMQVISELLSASMTRHLESTWSVLRKGIVNASGIARHHLASYLGHRFRDKDTPGVLFQVPRDALLSWCREAPDIVPAFVVEIAPPLINIEPQSEGTWNPVVRAILDEFGSRKDVINALSRNLGTFSHSGSLVPYYRRYLSPLRELTQHSNPVVRRWARSALEWHMNRIDEEQKRDDEAKIGIR